MAATHTTREAGKAAVLLLREIDEPAELAYAPGANPCAMVVRGDRVRAA